MGNREAAHEDHRSFDELAHAWGKAANDDPMRMIEALLQAFWRGVFERDGRPCVFSLEKPEGAYVEYVNGVICKVTDHGLFATAERAKFQYRRSDMATIARNLCDLAWDGTEGGIAALATYPIAAYRPEFLKAWVFNWRVRREHFAAWYETSPLSVGVPLESFWPHPIAKPDDRPTPRPRTGGGYRGKIWEAAEIAFPRGIPENYDWATVKRHLMPILQERQLVDPSAKPIPKTFARALKDYPRTAASRTSEDSPDVSQVVPGVSPERAYRRPTRH